MGIHQLLIQLPRIFHWAKLLLQYLATYVDIKMIKLQVCYLNITPIRKFSDIKKNNCLKTTLKALNTTKKSIEMTQNQSQLPINLVEALGATPFTYLVPTQNLANITTFGQLQLPIEQEFGTMEYNQYAQGLKAALESNSAQHRELKNKIREHLNFEAAVSSSNVSFNVLENQKFVEDSASEPSRSLFDGLEGLARDIVDHTPLIRARQFSLRKTQSITKQTLQQEQQQMKGIPLIVPEQKSQNDAPQGSQHPSIQLQTPLPSIPQKHHTEQPVPKEIQVKKRKSDVATQHSQLKNTILQKLNDLVANKIMLKDEDAEYESSDLWIEWNDSSHTLSDTVILEIQQYLSVLEGTSLIDQVPFEVLQRIQVLLMRSVTNAIGIDWSTIDDSEFESLSKFAHNALKSILLIFAILNLKRTEKKLYRDSYMMDSLSFIYTYVEDLVLKKVALEDLTFKKLIPSLYLISNAFSRLAQYIPSNQIDDTITTKLEYLTILILFTQSDRSLLFFKTSSLSLLTSIFQSKEDQRGFIIEEVLNNFERLPTHKIYSRQIKLSRGTSIQLFTVILLNLIKCLNLSSTTYANDITGVEPKNETQENEKLKEDRRFQDYIVSTRTERHKLLATIASNLVTKMINNPSHITKQQFELLVCDLLGIVSFPEWSASSELLAEVIKTVMFVSESQSSIVETHLLEMIGLIGSKMLEIKGPSEIVNRSTADLTAEYKDVLAYLFSIKNQKYFESSYDFLYSQWIESLSDNAGKSEFPIDTDIYYKLLAGYYQGRKNDLFSFGDSGPNALELKATSSYNSILLHSHFMNLYNSFLNHLLKSVDHPKIKSKTRALKNLAMLIDKDQRLLDIPQIKQSLFNKINDSSALVKLAVLDIFDQYILQKPTLAQDLYQSIILTNDKSIAVRIKSIRIAKKMFFFAENKEISISILEKILRRLEDDEESVLDLTKSTLIELLFDGIIKNLDDQFQAKLIVAKIAELMVVLVNKSEKNWDLFETFLFGDIIRRREENVKIHDGLMEACFKITTQLFDYIVNHMDTDQQKEVEESLGLLSILSKSDIPFINQDQLLSLQTYLTSDQNSGKISYYSLVILRNTLNHTTSLRDQFITSSLTSLLKKLTKFNTKELDQAMPSIWALSEMKKDTSKVANAAASCLSLINPYIEKAVKGELVEFSDQKVLRLIYLIGSFGRYCDLEKNRSIFQNTKKFQLKEKETVLNLLTKTVMIFTRSNVNRQIRRVGLRNLIHICSTHAKLFTTEAILSALDNEILKDDNDDFKEVIIQGLLDFLVNEEKDSIKKVGHDKKLSAKVGLDVDIFHGNSKTFENDGICASLVQRYTESILELCLKEDGGVSFLAVKFLRFIVKLGFANPRICAPTVIALEASPVSFIRNIGFELHRELHEKHESLVDTSYIRGVKLAASFRTKVSADVSGEDNQFFARFYKIIENSRASKKKVFTQLIKYFNFNVSNFKLEDFKSLNEFLIFFVPNIDQVDFDTYEYVIELVEGIDTVIHRHIASISKRFNESPSEEEPTHNEELLSTCYQAAIVINLVRLLTNIRHNYRLSDLKYTNSSEVKGQKVKVVESKSVVEAFVYQAEKVPMHTVITEFDRTKSNYVL